MLGLNNSRWQRLDHAYGPARDIPDLLREMQTAPMPEAGDWRAEPWFALSGSVCHQFTVYSASYATVPHLVRLAEARPTRDRLWFVSLAATIEICRHQLMAPLIPGDLVDAYDAAIARAAELTLECLALDWDANPYRELLGSLAALQGRPLLAASILPPPEEVECPACGACFADPRHQFFGLPADLE